MGLEVVGPWSQSVRLRGLLLYIQVWHLECRARGLGSVILILGFRVQRLLVRAMG